MSKKQKLGIVWVDTASMNSGFTCYNGKVEEVNNFDKLDPQVIWISNLRTQKNFYGFFTAYPNIRHAQFFRIPLTQVCIELNINYDADLHEKLRSLETIFDAIATCLYDQYNIDWTTEKDSILHIASKQLLGERNLRLTLDGKQNTVELKYAIENSLQRYQQATYRYEKKHQQMISLIIPRSAFSLALMQNTFPISGAYKSDETLFNKIAGVANGDVGEDSEEVKNYLETLSIDKAGFVEFDYIDINNKHSPLFQLGKERVARQPRTWAAIPEILFMLNYTQIKIKKMFITSGGHLDFHPKLPNMKDIKFKSYVRGIVNEIIWCSLSYTPNNVLHDPNCVYYRAYDRIMTGVKAENLLKADFPVAGFGVGLIRVIMDKNANTEQDRLKNFALDNYLIPQFNLL